MMDIYLYTIDDVLLDVCIMCITYMCIHMYIFICTTTITTTTTTTTNTTTTTTTTNTTTYSVHNMYTCI